MLSVCLRYAIGEAFDGNYDVKENISATMRHTRRVRERDDRALFAYSDVMSHFFCHLLQSIFRTVVIFFAVFRFFSSSSLCRSFFFSLFRPSKCVRNVYSLIETRGKNGISHSASSVYEMR